MNSTHTGLCLGAAIAWLACAPGAFGLAGFDPAWGKSDPRLVIRSDPENAYFFDDRTEVPCDCEKCRQSPAPARERGYPQKLLGVGGHREQLSIEHPKDLPVALEVSDPAMVALETRDDGTGVAQALLTGRAEGEGWLLVKAEGRVLSVVRLVCRERRTITCSFSYIQYPGEPDHAVKREGPADMAWISALYGRANVGIAWTDNGIRTLEWDLNGDGNSYREDYKEVWSPLDQHALPDAEKFFSNLFILRFNKDAAYFGGSNGGGTSRGYGPTDRPPRGAMVRAHLFPGPHQYAATLAHELGHNLGLAHTPHSQPNNVMTIARKDNQLSAEQWEIIHHTLQQLSGELSNSYPAATPSLQPRPQ